MGGTIDSGGVIRHAAHSGNWGQHNGLSGLVHNDYSKLKHILQNMHPEHVQTAGDAYKGVASRLLDTITLIDNQAKILSESWTGSAGVNGSSQLQTMYTAVREVHEKSDTTGGALQQHAATQRKYQGEAGVEHWYGVDVGTGGTGVGGWLKGESHIAHVIMNNLQNDTVTNNDKFPPDLRAHIPDTIVTPTTPTDNSGPSSSGTPINTHGDNGVYFSGTDPHNQGTNPGLDPSQGGPGQHGHVIGGTGGPGTGDGSSLAGFNPAGNTPGLIGGGGAGAGAGGFGAGAGAGAGAGLGAGLPLGAGLGAGMGANGVIGGQTAAEAESALAGEEAAASRNSFGRGMAGQGEEEEEQEREVNLTEDDKSWAEADGLVPPMIG